jgi:hypothetical protein
MNTRAILQVLVTSLVSMTVMITLRPTAQSVAPVPQTDVSCNEPALPDTFLSRAEIVMLRVSVTDADRRPIAGLTRGDFTVREDGQPQAVRFFSDDDVPVTVVDASGGMARKPAHVAAGGRPAPLSERLHGWIDRIWFVTIRSRRVFEMAGHHANRVITKEEVS